MTVDFRALIESSTDAIAVLDRDARCVYANSAYEAMSVSTDHWRAAIAEVLERGEPRALRDDRPYSARLWRLDADHAVVVVRVRDDARERTRRLQQLTATLSGAVERDDVVRIFVDAGHSALGAAMGIAWMARDAATLQIAAASSGGEAPRRADFETIPLSAHIPVCDAVRTGKMLVFESHAVMSASYPGIYDPAGTPYRAWAVIPFVVGGRGIGAVSFSFTTERTFSHEDRELLAAMSGQASLALERCRLLESERRARTDAEAARVRERDLHVIAARLSSALTQREIVGVVGDELVRILDARVVATSVVVDGAVELLGTAGTILEESEKRFRRVRLDDDANPTIDAVRTGELVWCSTPAELVHRYPGLATLVDERSIGAMCAAPFMFEGRRVGALTAVFANARPFAVDDMELLRAVGQLTAQALERARLYDRLRQNDEHLRNALTAARAATWRIDLATMESTRDPSYATLVGQAGMSGAADFSAIHPDDRPIARAAFARALEHGEDYAPTVRLRRDDGTYVWVQAHGRITYDAAGKPVELSGVIVDVDEARTANLRAEQERRINDAMHRLASSFASELDHDRLIERIVDELVAAVGADTGSFDAVPSRGDQPFGPSMLEVPVIGRSGETYGVLHLRHSEKDRFTEEHARLVASVANHAAVAIENARLYRTVREQKEQLEVAVERARTADRRKDEFLAMLGHELRNPLAPITTALDLMNLKQGGDTGRERDVIRRQVDHLSHLIDDLLDVSRITRGKVQLTKHVIELAPVLARAIEMASPLLEKRSQRLTVQLPDDSLLVDADATRLAQVFQNLVTNASKYSDPKASIVVRGTGTDDEIIVDVEDEGIGIPPELLPNLFDLFVQGERTLDRAQGGLGIGLTIARSLLEMHGGSISATSAGTGHGSTFTVRLPRSIRPRVDTDGMRPLRALMRATEAARVLVVDDNVDAAMMLSMVLGELGHELQVAHDGPSALEIAATFKPDIAVLDIGLPVMTGYELARRLREKLGNDRLRLIALSGYGQEADRKRARESGFDHHLIKPIEMDALLALLGK